MIPFELKAGSRSIPVSPASKPGVWEWTSSTGAVTRPVPSITRRRPGGSVKKRWPSGAKASDHGLSRPVATSSVCSVLSLATVGLGDGVGVGEALGLGDGDGLGDAEGVGEAVGEGVGMDDEPLTLPQPVRVKIRVKKANT